MDDGFIQENREHLEDAYFALNLTEDYEEFESEDESDSEVSIGEVSGEENDEDFVNRSNSGSKDRKKDARVI